MKNQRSKFSLPLASAYINCAYMSPLMKKVERAGLEGMRKKRNPFAISHHDFFSESVLLRREFAKLINAPDSQRVAIIPSASYGLSTAARNIKIGKGDSIVLIHEQFPSNVYPWQRLAAETGATISMVKPPDLFEHRGKAWNTRLLESIVPGTKIVAMGNVHWADGTRFELEAVGKRAREVGAKLVIDGTQSVGALPFDIAKVKPDVLVCAGYKWLMGPYSIGLAYFSEDFDEGIPLEENWINRLVSEDFTGLVQYKANYQPGALRYEVGEHSNFILVPMMLEALRQVNQWGPENIQSYCHSITEKGIEKLRKAGCWVEDSAFRGHHLFGIRFPSGSSLDKIKDRVSKKKISVSFRGDSMRVSPHVYNTMAEFNRLVSAITESI
ncbi:MAG: aminotransferase class V-fold PLP-dependent enzyme [Cyclobacteriaceae bacterium]|nr:aminotransferase class V-fold PLP-dependent enzyme [Cyclobacteriaceae bacterium]